jgi:hypothetical protein
MVSFLSLSIPSTKAQEQRVATPPQSQRVLTVVNPRLREVLEGAGVAVAVAAEAEAEVEPQPDQTRVVRQVDRQ